MKIKYFVLIATFLAVLSVPAFAEKVLLVDFVIGSNDSISLNGMLVAEGRATYWTEGNYKIQLLDSANKVISSQLLPVDFFIPEFGETNTTIAEARLSNFENAKKLQVSHDKKVIFESSIALCNSNGICDNYENGLSCPSDCLSGSADRYCDKVKDGKCDPDCAKDADEDCKSFLEKTNFVYIGGAIIVLTVIFLLIKKKKTKEGLANNAVASIAAPEQEKIQPVVESPQFEADPVLLEWAREQLAKGYTREQVKLGLTKGGYPTETADGILRRI